ncbi:hypothetical protein BC624_11514 [Flavobacterium granuli]|uniref:Uncharacterized protein n=1 Tax=Flavobacterium granuli TaxID=280093 RepID=A0A1M5U2G7_9FLAO|nr:hypothetical protein BC624_11514 [Flavobacterium granuli]SHH57222.1 hypothetical protein SAMN05443373_11714 [Flavobacterium granuli]
MKFVLLSIFLGVLFIILNRKYLLLNQEWEFFILIYIFLITGNEIIKFLKKNENEKN